MHPHIRRLLADLNLPERAGEAIERTIEALAQSNVDDKTLATVAGTPADGPERPLTPHSATRYRDAGPLGSGGMGEVRRVSDQSLGRQVAIKRLHRALQDSDGAVDRFIAEARTHARLQHPNIVPVYDAGVDESGRPWFTQREVHGQTMTRTIDAVHGVSEDRWGVTVNGDSLQRLVMQLTSVAHALHYAHGQSVTHRDLKPDNILVGSAGEVYVVDWGLSSVLTETGRPIGTPAYMAPEQAGGALGDALSDVYALGAVLYTILAGRPPYTGASVSDTLQRVQTSDPPSLRDAHPPPPPALQAIVARAMARDRYRRYPSALAFADALEAWTSGTERRQQAIRLLGIARQNEQSAHAASQRARQLRTQGDTLMAQILPSQPEEDKAPAWLVLDEAERAERDAERQQLAVDAALTAALRMDPELADAASQLALRHLARHREAESGNDRQATERAERGIREHIAMLPDEHPTRVECSDYLKGDGNLTLLSTPAGAAVSLYRYERQNRRLVEVFERDLGVTPIQRVQLPMGSYMCRISHPGHDTVRYPVHITRQHHWDGVAHGEHDPTPVTLPKSGTLPERSVVVPSGWFQSGGDPDTYRSHPARRLWCESLVVDVFAVTNAQYIGFLDDLVSQGREDEALRFVPRERSSSEGVLGAVLYGRTEAGGFCLQPDADGDLWDPQWPVFHVDWHGAHAYMRWRAERTGYPWRLLGELEWEKAARGVDGRVYPWGDTLDPSWCRMHDSAADGPMPACVDTYPVDVSVYGVRGVGGNVRDWCADIEGAVDGYVVLAPTSTIDDRRRTIRGGSWFDAPRNARVANRDRNVVGLRLSMNGFRGGFRLSEWAAAAPLANRAL